MVFMAAGAMFLTWYIEWRSPALEAEVKNYERSLNVTFWVLLLAHSALQSYRHSEAAVEDISPRWSGALVVLLTGLTATINVASPSGADSPMLAAAILVGTLMTVAAIWRFATDNAVEIGEVRFKR